MDLEYFDNLWKENRHFMGSTSQDYESFWDKRADFMAEWKKQRKGTHNHQNVIKFLQHKKMLQPDFSVLDIGCGQGEHTKKLASVAKEVIGTDISQKMLEYAQKNTDKEKLSNTLFIKTDWDELDLSQLKWEKKFNLVFASMTPAIGSRNSLEKMIQASKQYCFSSYPVLMRTAIRDNIAAYIGDDSLKKHDPCKTVYCLTSMLFLMGYYPEIHYEDNRWELEMTVDQALDRFGVQILDKADDNSSAKIAAMREYLQGIAKQDKVTEIMESKIAWVTWKV